MSQFIIDRSLIIETHSNRSSGVQTIRQSQTMAISVRVGAQGHWTLLMGADCQATVPSRLCTHPYLWNHHNCTAHFKVWVVPCHGYTKGTTFKCVALQKHVNCRLHQATTATLWEMETVSTEQLLCLCLLTDTACTSLRRRFWAKVACLCRCFCRARNNP